MKIHYYPNQYEVLQDTVLTIGSFDGVHLGHAEILRKMVYTAEKHQLQTCLVTFQPHPREVLINDQSLRLITSEEEKVNLLRQAGLDHLVIVHFDREFADQTAEDYVEKFLVQFFHPKVIIIGYDHRFGKNQQGNVALLKELGLQWGFEIIETQAQEIDNQVISSTQIRKALQSGNIHKANSMLGYPFSITGQVIHGQKLGRDLGFPTANLQLLDNKKILPKIGIYAVKILIGNNLYNGMLYIGHRPSIAQAETLSIEVHIFNFSQNIYDQSITLLLKDYIREDQQFDELSDLQAQLQLDQKAAEKILSNQNSNPL